MNNFFRKCLHQTMRMHVDESMLDIQYIKMSKSEISYFNLSSNPILSFICDGKLCYFRECPRILSFNEYFEKAVEKFFETIHQLHINEKHFKQEIPIEINFSKVIVSVFREYLQKLLNCESFWKTISRVDKISQKMKFSIWEPHSYTSDFFDAYGLCNLPNDCYDIAIYFIWYMRSASAIYRTLNIVRGKKYSYFSGVRSVASTIVADAIGLGHMITSARFCRIEFDDGEIILGVISDAASGTRMVDSSVQLNGSLQKELLNLNVLDLICFQTDHGANNYNVFEQEGVYTVCAFDNDNPNTFLPVPMIKHNFLGCSSLVTSEGLLNRPYISKEMISNIQSVDVDRLKKQLKPYMNSLQIGALIFRLKKIRNMFEKSINRNPNLAIADNEWNDKTVMEEVNGKYGRTYLSRLL